MGIAESLIDSFQSNLRDYFESNEWEEVYCKKIDGVFHDDDLMGGILFYPYSSTGGFPTTRTLDAGGDVAFELTYIYVW